MKGSRISRRNFSSTARCSEWKKVIALLQTNLKTHKPPPEQVKPKAIHLSTKNPSVPHGKCVAWKLRTVLSAERHILNSGEEFHARIEELELDQDDRPITADVKDFFVVGDHWDLARVATSILESKDRNLIEKVIQFLLRNQFVTSTLSESEGVFQVRASDLWQVVKLVIQCILKQEVKRERHTKAYSRYRDDIIFIVRGGNGNLVTLAKHLKHVAVTCKSPHLIEDWAVSSESVLSIWTLNCRKVHVGKQ